MHYLRLCLSQIVAKLTHEDHASVAELVDALDLGSSGVTRESSSLSTRIHILNF